jgi:hypothetical protein
MRFHCEGRVEFVENKWQRVDASRRKPQSGAANRLAGGVKAETGGPRTFEAFNLSEPALSSG